MPGNLDFAVPILDFYCSRRPWVLISLLPLKTLTREHWSENSTSSSSIISRGSRFISAAYLFLCCMVCELFHAWQRGDLGGVGADQVAASNAAGRTTQ